MDLVATDSCNTHARLVPVVNMRPAHGRHVFRAG